MELGPLLRKHDAEIMAKRQWGPLCIDLPRYLALEQQNMLLLITVRAGTRLVGYSIDVISRDLEYAKTPLAMNQLIWLHPDFRTGRGLSLVRQPGFQLLMIREKMLDDLKITRRKMTAMVWHNFGPLLKKLGYELEHVGYQRVVMEA